MASSTGSTDPQRGGETGRGAGGRVRTSGGDTHVLSENCATPIDGRVDGPRGRPLAGRRCSVRKVAAASSNGVVTITIPKKPGAQPKKIPVAAKA